MNHNRIKRVECFMLKGEGLFKPPFLVEVSNRAGICRENLHMFESSIRHLKSETIKLLKVLKLPSIFIENNMSSILIELCNIIKLIDRIVRNEIHCLTLAMDTMIRNKFAEDVRNEEIRCTRSTTDESNAVIKDLKEKRTSRMKNGNTNDCNFREELNRIINEFYHEERNH